jgi:small subunit ribosomal protein S16
MLAIRLSRVGKKNSAYFRVVVMDKQKSAKGRALEVLGSVNPHKNEIVLKNERILYWIGVGAQPSDRVHNILISQGVIKGDKITKKIRKKKQSGEETDSSTPAANAASAQNDKKEAAPEEPKEEPKKEESKEEK